MKIIKLFLLSTLCFFALNSCKKEGCIDSNATNFNSDAKKDDGSCKYEGNAVIWFNGPKVIEYSATGTTNLVFYLDGVQIGTLALLDFMTSEPVCGAAQTISIKKDLGNSPTKSYNLLVKGDSGATLDTYTLTVKANKCTPFLLN